ncbi:NADH dehydrogenase [ubiquinone] 1 alpha subcomplex assembly factor 2 isoform X2 [Rhinoderma darwinii]|uniref:NADH dehydrogenase [ubiquinone] 1 alpha subcomplex assembly factor 2 isoform X2 n=1 Tax=Rhinoderma darwinii TaxID=43563 RepID=UPI003F66DA3D
MQADFHSTRSSPLFQRPLASFLKLMKTKALRMCMEEAEYYHLGQAMRARRMVEPVQKDVYKYQIGHIPTEWEAWIRGKRKDPPTIEEILKNAQLRQDISAKGEEFLKNEKAMSSIESKDGVQAHSVKTQIKGHASAPVYEKQTLIEEPTSTANTFVPGSWNPQKK